MDSPKFIRYPFAATGDKTVVPDDIEPNGNLSYAEGYGFDYERNPVTDPQAKRIERDKMNQLHHDITSNIRQYQLYSTPWFYDSTANGGKPVSYPKGAKVRYKIGKEENTYISLIDNNTSKPDDSNHWAVSNDADYAMRDGSRNFAIAGGDANFITASLNLPLDKLVAGLPLNLKVKLANNGATSLNLNGLGFKPIVYHQTGEPLVGGDFQVGEVISLIFDGENFRLQPTVAYMDTRYSRLIAPPSSTFYVIGPTGNDNNSGINPTPEEGFATIQGAIDALSNRYITVGTITIIVSPGTYDGFEIYNSLVASWCIKGDPNNSDLVRVIATDPKKWRKNACGTGFGTQTTLSNLTLSGLLDTVETTLGAITLYDCNIILGNQSYSRGVACYGGSINLYGKMNISGSGTMVFHATSGGNMGFGFYNSDGKWPLDVTYNNVSVNETVVSAQKNANISVASAVVTFRGMPDGAAYAAFDNAIINTWGGGLGIFPGTRPGVIFNGGQAG